MHLAQLEDQVVLGCAEKAQHELGDHGDRCEDEVHRRLAHHQGSYNPEGHLPLGSFRFLLSDIEDRLDQREFVVGEVRVLVLVPPRGNIALRFDGRIFFEDQVFEALVYYLL